MDKTRLLAAGERTAAFFERLLDPESGQLRQAEVSGDLAAQYKLPTLLLLTGRAHLAHKVLDNIKRHFLQPSGDLVSYPGKAAPASKSEDTVLGIYWPYINGWVAMAAQRLGRFDVSVPAREYVEAYYNEGLKGYGISHEDFENGRPQDVDIFMSAHLGLLALYTGDITRAEEIGECMERFVALQPDLGQHFLLRMSAATGQLLADIPAGDTANLFRVSRTEPNQLMFLLGYPLMFLYFLHLADSTPQDPAPAEGAALVADGEGPEALAAGDHQAEDPEKKDQQQDQKPSTTTETGGERARHASPYLATAERILQFILTCHDSLYSLFLSHKAAVGAALVAKATGEAEYRRLSERIAQHLLQLQSEEGDFMRDHGLPVLARLDQSAEIAVWFRELANYVC